ncbi:MAG TPA: hypothetical protein VHC94_16585, partial [Nitrobacter sp.]|nr:hypothetical protein [Nitrobacter sp.]
SSTSGRLATSVIPKNTASSPERLLSRGHPESLRSLRKNPKREVPPMQIPTQSSPDTPYEPWYKYGIAVLSIEMLIAVAVSAYSLFMTFQGLGGFPGKH